MGKPLPTITPGYPLNWPLATPRTQEPVDALFRLGHEASMKHLREEIHRFGYDASQPVVLSTNIPHRKDGFPFAVYRVEDAGVALYFTRAGKPLVLACDLYKQVKDNVHSIGQTIEDFRSIDRHGVAQALERSLQGFLQIEHQTEVGFEMLPWWSILNLVPTDAGAEIIRTMARALAQRYHPDREGGDAQAMAAINSAKDVGLRGGTELVKVPTAFMRREYPKR